MAEADNLPEPVDESEIDTKAVEMRVAGASEREICATLGINRSRIRKAVDEAMQDALTPISRLRAVFLAQARVLELLPVFIKQAKTGDCQSALVVDRLMAREALQIGLGGLHQHDPIELAKEAAPQLNSTQQIERVLENLMAEDKQALRNGGPGYNDWRDDRDRELMARRAEREKPGDDG